MRSSYDHGGFRRFMWFATVVLFVGVAQAIFHWSERPNLEQQIVATMVSWGLSLDGIAIPVDPAAVARHVADLNSPDGEIRVQAADWLASRGVRTSAADIAAAMDDPGTLRPCQLAKSLGELGDEQWTDKLIAATQQRHNTDLRVCATIALGELQPPRAIAALIEVYRTGTAPATALEALGRIADPACLPFLRQVAAAPHDHFDRTMALLAIEHITVMQQPDPVAALMLRLRRQTAQGDVERWTVRKLAILRDVRAVPVLAGALARDQKRKTQIPLAAALLSYGDAGRIALRRMGEHSVSASNGGGEAAVVRAALHIPMRNDVATPIAIVSRTG